MFLEGRFAKGGVLALGSPVLPRAGLLWAPAMCSTRTSPGTAVLVLDPTMVEFMRDRLGRQPQPPQCPSMSWKGTGKTQTVSRQQPSQIQLLSLLGN